MKITDVKALRRDFPIFRHRTYVDTACYAPGYARVAQAAADWHSSAMLMPGTSFDQTLAWLKPVAFARVEAAKLLGAQEEEIAFITSTGMGNCKIADALDLKAGDNVVINDLEFPSNVIAFTARQRKGVEIRRVNHQGGRLLLDDFAKLVDDRTRLIAISSVQWTNGFRMDLKSLVDLAESKKAYVVVDSCQSLGAMELDVRKTGIHFMVTQSHKWLFGPFSTGLMFVRRDLIGKYDPTIVESGNLFKNPARQPYHHQLDLDNLTDYAIEFVDTAAKYQSCPNLPGLWGLYESLKTINAYGIANIEERVLHLTDRLIERLRAVKGFTVSTPCGEGERSGIVSATTGSVDTDLETMRRLSQLGVGVSVRYQAGCGGVRMSLHFYNDEEDIDRLISALLGETKPLYFH
ncbi:putative Aminotransferase, class V [uncultured delta proteobacterium]|uniref:Putative Aminotransferase, class V n=1 Tax=uncultured delta proteobacterium TaxID=34034 RepID=A0A212IYH2_9DELT|nr:putative Aminotransferase, class V [uncultured delta proteobacterium]